MLRLMLILALLIPQVAKASNDPTTCLAATIAYEAHTEPLEGKIAVGQVVLNRANNPERPKTICGVVKEKNQFSWVKEGKPISNKGIVAEEMELARNIMNGVYEDVAHGAEYFHTKDVHPAWTKNLQKISVIGSHRFYRSRDYRKKR